MTSIVTRNCCALFASSEYNARCHDPGEMFVKLALCTSDVTLLTGTPMFNCVHREWSISNASSNRRYRASVNVAHLSFGGR